MNITIAICTWNRAKLLRQTLEQMTKLRHPESISWELLVVNNNSTDNTEEVVNEFGGRLPVRHIFEPKQGLSHARNRAISEAKGDYIIWTDDDVLVDEYWLIEYVKGFNKYPDAAFFGGPIGPWFETRPPKWIQQNFSIFETAYACRNISFKELVIDNAKITPFGANMAVKQFIYQKIKYDPELGRKGHSLIGGEETTFFRFLLKDGWYGIWIPTARVKHFITKERLSRKYIREYYEAQGRFLAITECYSEKNVALFFGMPRWRIRRLITLYLKTISCIFFSRNEYIKKWQCYQTEKGLLKEYFRNWLKKLIF